MTAMVEWSSDLELPIEQVNEQHKQLINTVNTLARAVEAGDPQAEIDKVLFFLVGYVEQHFNDEEELMGSMDYPYLGLHHEVHQELVKKVEANVQHYMRGDELDMRALMAFLNRWLVEHICGMDRQFADWVRAR